MQEHDAKGQAVINRWAREEERKKARAEASEENFKKTFADTLRQENVKKALAREAKDAVDNPQRRDAIFDQASEGTSRGYNDHEVITGEEPRPWENDY